MKAQDIFDYFIIFDIKSIIIVVNYNFFFKWKAKFLQKRNTVSWNVAEKSVSHCRFLSKHNTHYFFNFPELVKISGTRIFRSKLICCWFPRGIWYFLLIFWNDFQFLFEKNILLPWQNKISDWHISKAHFFCLKFWGKILILKC